MLAGKHSSVSISSFLSIAAVSICLMSGIAGCGTSSSATAPSLGSTSASASSTAPAGKVSGGANLGLLWSPADKTLRPVVGVPGSSWMGASVVPAGAYQMGAYSSASSVALLIDSRGNLSILSSPTFQPVVLAQGIPANSVIAFSPAGTQAALFVPGAASAMLLAGLPAQPSLTVFHATSSISGMAIGDDGTLLVASQGSAGFSIVQVSRGGTSSTVASVAGFGGMAFLPGTDDFLLADSVNNTLARMHNGSLQILATKADGLNQPLAVAASADSQWTVVANQADGSLLRLSLTGATAPARTVCACSPSELTPLAGNAVFALTPPGTAPSWLIDAGRTVPGVFFVPPAQSTTGSSK